MRFARINSSKVPFLVPFGKRRRLSILLPALALAALLAGCQTVGPNPGQAPAAPANLRAAVGDARLTLSWDAVPGATSYNLYLATEAGVTKENYQSKPGGARQAGVSSPHVQTGLSNGTTYYLVVTAVNAAGESDESAEVTAAPVVSGGVFSPEADTELAAGEYNYAAVTIPAGITVTVLGDVLIHVGGDTTIGGTLTGDCTTIELRGAGALILDGLIANTCSDPAEEPADLKLVVDGELTVGSTVSDDEAIVTDGFLTLTDTATETISLEPIAEVSSLGSNGSEAVSLTPTQAGGGMVLNRPVRGRRGASIHHAQDIAANAAVFAADGETIAALQAAPNCDNSSRRGGSGGSVYLAVRDGVLTINGTVQAGNGGGGGACEADASGQGVAASATGGPGGRGGGVYVGGPQIVFGPAARLIRGNGGPGGEATAIGSDGLAPCADGFGATASGGPGGEAGSIGYIILEPGAVVGNPSEDGGNGGQGGPATATAGAGQDCEDGNGGDGGPATATGGRGGDGAGQNIWPVAPNSHLKGDGGNATANGGDGGPGGDACDPPEQGGNGGAGGAATATGGEAAAGGMAGGSRGDTAGVAGTGGDGGEGDPSGDGGAAGSGTGVPDDIPDGDAGAPGLPCPVDEPPQGVLHFLDLGDFPQGVLEPGGYALAVMEDDQETATGESVTATVRSDGAEYVKEGDQLFVGAGGGLEFDFEGLAGRVRAVRVVLDGCGTEGSAQLRGLVANEVVASDTADLGAAPSELEIDFPDGLDDVFLETVDNSSFCLGAWAVELGIEPAE